MSGMGKGTDGMFISGTRVRWVAAAVDGIGGRGVLEGLMKVWTKRERGDPSSRPLDK